MTQVMWLGIYGVTFLLIIAQWKRFINIATRDKFLLLLMGIALVSVLWSVAPEVTLRRNVALVGTTMVGAYLATRYELSELLRLLAWAMGIAALLSLAFGLALPSYGIDNHSAAGAWQGIYSGGKNELGRSMALSALTFLLLALSAREYRWIAWAGFGLSVALLLLSNSQTSLVSFLILLPLLLCYSALRWHYTLAIPCVIIAILVVGTTAFWLVGGGAESVLGLLGRDLTLTNRTAVWPAVIEMIRQRPWLGYGYGAFWLGWEGESAHVWLWNYPIRLRAEHAHNGFLDLWLSLGLLGVLTFAFGYSLAVLRSINWARRTKTAEGLFPLAYFTLMLMWNTTENSILLNNNIVWILYVALGLSTVVGPSKVDGAE